MVFSMLQRYGGNLDPTKGVVVGDVAVGNPPLARSAAHTRTRGVRRLSDVVYSSFLPSQTLLWFLLTLLCSPFRLICLSKCRSESSQPFLCSLQTLTRRRFCSQTHLYFTRPTVVSFFFIFFFQQSPRTEDGADAPPLLSCRKTTNQ